MNEQLRPPSLPATTQAAEGLLRRRFSVAEIEEMVAKGIIAEDERIELIGGEVVPMSPKGRRHEIIRSKLVMLFSRQCPETLAVATEIPLKLADDIEAHPDLIVHPASVQAPDARGASVLLLVEVADSSLFYDLSTKAATYAAHGVREYWVINARTLETTRHRTPAGDAYGEVGKLAGDQRLTPTLAPDLSVVLSELDLD